MSASDTTPPFGLTLQAPWGACIAYLDKRVENRTKGVARTIGDYRGPVALTASKSHTIGDRSLSFGSAAHPNSDVHHHVAHTLYHALAATAQGVPPSSPISYQRVLEMAGTWFATANIVAIQSPGNNHGPWAAVGAWGIVLENVVVLDRFEPATGGQGFFAFARCTDCARPTAKGARHRCGEGHLLDQESGS